MKTGADGANFTVKLRDILDGPGLKYVVSVDGRPLQSSDPIAFQISKVIPKTAGFARSLALVVALCQQAIVPFLSVEGPGKTEEGSLSISAHAGKKTKSQAASPWYVEPKISGGYFGGNVVRLNVGGGLDINYSDPEWRALIELSARYSYLDLNLPSASLKGDFVTAFGRMTIARTLIDGLSLAARIDARSAPQNNITLRTRGGVGAEWAYAPFLQANENNIGIRISIMATHDRYESVSEHDSALARAFLTPELELFTVIHTAGVDIELKGGGSFLTDKPEFWAVWGTGTLAFRIWDGLQIRLSGYLVYFENIINAPRYRERLNPVAAARGNNLNRITAGSELSLSWTIGSSLLRSQDQRWR